MSIEVESDFLASTHWAAAEAGRSCLLACHRCIDILFPNPGADGKIAEYVTTTAMAALEELRGLFKSAAQSLTAPVTLCTKWEERILAFHVDCLVAGGYVEKQKKTIC